MLLSLRGKLAAVVGLVGLTALGLAGFSSIQMDREHERASAVEAAWSGALQAQALARAIEHAVVASHAVYTAEDKEGARSKFQSLSAALEEVDRIKEPFLSWLAAAAPDTKQTLTIRIQEFLAYQRDTAELGMNVSPKAALIQATDESTTKNREMMVESIMQLGNETMQSLYQFRSVAEEERRQAKILLAGVSFASIILALIGASLFATAQIQRPLQRLQGTMTALAADDLFMTIPYLSRRDEIGAMARAIAIFQQAFREKRASDQQASARMAEELERGARLESAATSFELRVRHVTEDLSQAAEKMDKVARSMRDTAQATMQEVMSVASGVEHTSTDVKSTAEATNALSGSARDIEKKVKGAAAVATNALAKLSKTDMTARSLTSATDEIGSVIELIASIAAQTNLLALNATIEAARAGESGRGFAVVASEVKALANQTSRATDQISEQIGAIKAAAEATVQAIADTGQTIREINTISAVIATAAEEQQVATRHIAESVASASSRAHEMASGITLVKDAATSTGAIAGSVLEVSGHLAKTSQELSHEIAEFLARVRAA